MKRNEANVLYKIGVENLLVLPNNFVASDYYCVTTKTDEYGAESHISTLDKVKLCNMICDKSNVELQQILANIRVEIDKLLTI